MNNTVIVRECEDYDPQRIEAIVSEGMEHLGYRPSGKVFAKPNVVVAYQTEKLGSHAFTPPSFVAASFRKCVSLRYFQDMVYFVNRGLLRKI